MILSNKKKFKEFRNLEEGETIKPGDYVYLTSDEWVQFTEENMAGLKTIKWNNNMAPMIRRK